MTDPTTPLAMQQVALTRLKIAIRQHLSAEMATMASTAELNTWIAEDLARNLVFELRAHVLAEQLPPQTIRHRVRVTTTDPRHATWWDAYKDTHRRRWWMRWRHWKVSYVDTPVTVERAIEVNVRDHWTYPRAAIRLPEEWGRPVMVATWSARDFRWRDGA